MKVSTRFSCFLHIWYSDVWFFTVSSRIQFKTVHCYTQFTMSTTCCFIAPRSQYSILGSLIHATAPRSLYSILGSLIHATAPRSLYSILGSLIHAIATNFAVNTYSITSSLNVSIQAKPVSYQSQPGHSPPGSKCHITLKQT